MSRERGELVVVVWWGCLINLQEIPAHEIPSLTFAALLSVWNLFKEFQYCRTGNTCGIKSGVEVVQETR